MKTKGTAVSALHVRKPVYLDVGVGEMKEFCDEKRKSWEKSSEAFRN